MMKISTQFDAGSVVVKDLSNPADIRLALRPDNASEFAQWFYFRLQGAAYQNCVMHFEMRRTLRILWAGRTIRLAPLTTVKIGSACRPATKTAC